MAGVSPVKDILIQARALIADRKHWTRNAAARDAHGHPTVASDPRATRFCATGALKRIEPNQLMRWRALDLLEGDAQSIVSINDDPVKNGGGHKAVLAAYDRAIEAA